MFILLFLVLILQVISFWIYEPLVTFMTNVIEIKFAPISLLLISVVLFSAKKDSILSELKEIDKIKKISSKPKTNEAKIIDIRQS